MNRYCLLKNGSTASIERMEDMIASYVSLQCGLRGLDPSSIIKTYLPGIAATFDMKRARCAENFRRAMNGKEIKLVTKGFTKRFDREHPKAEKIKMPYGYDLAIRSKKVMKKNKLFHGKDKDILMWRAFVCQVIGITFLLRKSEHISARDKKGKSVIPLRRKHFTFFYENGRAIKYKNIGRDKHEAHTVTINVRFAKTDKSGYGRRTSHTKQKAYPESCTVSILEKYIKATRDDYGCTEEDGIYEIPSYGTIGTKCLHKVMQMTVKDCGLHGMKKKVTSHSLRYGGATMLAAAGLPHYIIAIYGGWTQESKSLRIYTHKSEKMIERVSRYMSRIARTKSSEFLIREAYVIARGSEKK